MAGLDKLPRTLDAWRVPDKLQDEDAHWNQLSETSLRTLGYCLWTKADWGWLQQSTDGATVSPNGYLLVTPMRGKEGPGLAYIHSERIAHRDAFKNNFLVQFFPESLKNGAVSISKPRVYLIDFEVAVQFPDDCPASERVCTGIPCTGSLANVSEYARPVIPEMLTGEPYDPFKLDVWQLASSFGEFDSTFEPVETLLDSMARDDPAGRLTADEAMARLRAFVESVPPKALLIPPVIHKFK
ncbi:hypothetical protein EV714DRAFT_273390 [Schizophyllum commune]